MLTPKELDQILAVVMRRMSPLVLARAAAPGSSGFRMLYGVAAEAIASAAAGTVTIHSGAPGSEATTAHTVEAYNASEKEIDDEDKVLVVNLGKGWYALPLPDAVPMRQIVVFDLPSTLAATDASKAACTVVRYYGGADPGATITVSNELQLEGASGERGYAVREDDGTYRAWNIVHRQLVRIEITDDDTPAGEYLAKRLAWTGAAYAVEGAEFTVYDWQNNWPRADLGAQGYAIWCPDRDVHELLMLEPLDRVVLGKADTTIATGGSGNVSVWSGTAGSETDSGDNIEVDNRMADVLAGDWVWSMRTPDGWYYIIASQRNGKLLGKTDASHAKAASGTISIWTGTPGSETDSTINLTAYNRFAAVASGKWVWIEHNGDGWYLTAAECP